MNAAHVTRTLVRRWSYFRGMIELFLMRCACSAPTSQQALDPIGADIHPGWRDGFALVEHYRIGKKNLYEHVYAYAPQKQHTNTRLVTKSSTDWLKDRQAAQKPRRALVVVGKKPTPALAHNPTIHYSYRNALVAVQRFGCRVLGCKNSDTYDVYYRQQEKKYPRVASVRLRQLAALMTTKLLC